MATAKIDKNSIEYLKNNLKKLSKLNKQLRYKIRWLEQRREKTIAQINEIKLRIKVLNPGKWAIAQREQEERRIKRKAWYEANQRWLCIYSKWRSNQARAEWHPEPDPGKDTVEGLVIATAKSNPSGTYWLVRETKTKDFWTVKLPNWCRVKGKLIDFRPDGLSKLHVVVSAIREGQLFLLENGYVEDKKELYVVPNVLWGSEYKFGDSISHLALRLPPRYALPKRHFEALQ